MELVITTISAFLLIGGMLYLAHEVDKYEKQEDNND